MLRLFARCLTFTCVLAGAVESALAHGDEAAHAALHERESHLHALNQRLAGRNSLEFELSGMSHDASHGDKAHAALGAEWDDLFPRSEGFQMQAQYHFALNRWLSFGPLTSYQHLDARGRSFTVTGIGTINPSHLRLHRFMAGGVLRLQPGSPLRKTRFSLALSAQLGLAYYEDVHNEWYSATANTRARGPLYKRTATACFEVQARVALTFRASNFVRWGPEAWVGWNWTGAPNDSHAGASAGWEAAEPNAWRTVTFGGGITLEVLWGLGQSARARLAEDSRRRSPARRLQPRR